MEWNKFWELFHNAWSQAKESSEYKKDVFNEMQAMLKNMEYNLKKLAEKVIERRKYDRRKK